VVTFVDGVGVNREMEQTEPPLSGKTEIEFGTDRPRSRNLQLIAAL
jgi:hypothetical protein